MVFFYRKDRPNLKGIDDSKSQQTSKRSVEIFSFLRTRYGLSPLHVKRAKEWAKTVACDEYGERRGWVRTKEGIAYRCV